MQAIITKFIGATNTKPARIKAKCERGEITVGWPDWSQNPEQAHIEAAKALIRKFNAEDLTQYGEQSVKESTGWNQNFATGSIPSGEYVHVFVLPRQTTRVCPAHILESLKK